MYRSVLFALVSLLAGCAITPSFAVEASGPNVVRVSYYDYALDHSRPRQAEIMANAECRKYGKTASLVSSGLGARNRTVDVFTCQ